MKSVLQFTRKLVCLELKCKMYKFQKYFTTIQTIATKKKSLFFAAQEFIGTGIMTALWHSDGSVWVSEVIWKMKHSNL